MQVNTIFEQILLLNDCTIRPKIEYELSIPSPLVIPREVSEFYGLCNGVELFNSKDYRFEIVPFDQIVPFTSVLSAFYVECKGERISDYWYRIGLEAEIYIYVDFHPKRNGRCYHVSFDDFQLIALSFSQILSMILNTKGEYPEWYSVDFSPPAEICDF
jgi:antitoxin YokJ